MPARWAGDRAAGPGAARQAGIAAAASGRGRKRRASRSATAGAFPPASLSSTKPRPREPDTHRSRLAQARRGRPPTAGIRRQLRIDAVVPAVCRARTRRILPGLFGPAQDYHCRMPGEPRTGRGRASRERIVERAAELVAERGVEGTSLDEVLAAAGASKSQLYHYFAGRDELVEAAVARRCAQVLGELTQALGGVATLAELEAMLAGFIAGFEQQGLPGCPVGSLASEVAERNEGARLQAAAAFDAWEGLFADALERMRERGELRADASPGGLATALLASIEGGLLLSQTRKQAASLRIAVEAALAHVRTYRAPSLD